MQTNVNKRTELQLFYKIILNVMYFAIQGTKIMHIFAAAKQKSRKKNLLHNKSINMNTENAKSQMRKGMLEYCILLLLHRGPAYASDIIQQLKEAQLIVVEGTLYPLLTRLKNDRLLKYEWQESTQGPPRKYYALTLDGEEFLRHLDSAWNELTNTVNILHNGSDVVISQQ